MRRLAGKLTYANVISTICLFLLLGGGAAFAASQSTSARTSVGVKQLKKNSVTNAKIKKDAVTGGKVKDNSLSGADIDQASLTAVRAVQRHLARSSRQKNAQPGHAVPDRRHAPNRPPKGICKVTFPTSVIELRGGGDAPFPPRRQRTIIVRGTLDPGQQRDGPLPTTLAVSTYYEGNEEDQPFDLVLVC